MAIAWPQFCRVCSLLRTVQHVGMALICGLPDQRTGSRASASTPRPSAYIQPSSVPCVHRRSNRQRGGVAALAAVGGEILPPFSAPDRGAADLKRVGVES